MEIEVSVRALLAQRLAPLANAPLNVIRMLANDDQIKVACPILAQSERLDEATLIRSARTKSQEHLLAISQRKLLSEGVSDILAVRGNNKVVLSVAKNPGARFSEAGFAVLVERSEGDDLLATSVGSRPDIPHRLFIVLLSKASEMVRTRLSAENPRAKHQIHQAVTTVVDDIRNEARANSTTYSVAQALVKSLYDSAQLTDNTIRAFAEDENIEAIMESLVRICNLPIDVVEHAIMHDQSEMILVLAKAAKLSWATTKMLLSCLARQRGRSSNNVQRNMALFDRLTISAAQKIIEFYRKRRTGVSDNLKVKN